MTTVCVWIFARVAEGFDGHSGYEFSWSPFRVLPFTVPYGYHVFHHSHNIGNYCSLFRFWDNIFGSNEAYYKFMEEFKYNYAESEKANGEKTIKVD